MRPEFEFNYERSVNAPCGKSLVEKKKLAESWVRIAHGSDAEVITIDPEEMQFYIKRLECLREALGESAKLKERKENAE